MGVPCRKFWKIVAIKLKIFFVVVVRHFLAKFETKCSLQALLYILKDVRFSCFSSSRNANEGISILSLVCLNCNFLQFRFVRGIYCIIVCEIEKKWWPVYCRVKLHQNSKWHFYALYVRSMEAWMAAAEPLLACLNYDSLSYTAWQLMLVSSLCQDTSPTRVISQF